MVQLAETILMGKNNIFRSKFVLDFNHFLNFYLYYFYAKID